MLCSLFGAALQGPTPPPRRDASGGEARLNGPASLCNEEVCIETEEVVLCTEPRDQEGMHCVLQEGLSIEGQPVWACAQVEPPTRRQVRAPPPSMLLRLGRRDALTWSAAAALYPPSLGSAADLQALAARPLEGSASAPASRVRAAQSAATRLLADEETYRVMVQMGMATASLQLPPTLSFAMFKELEPRVADPDIFMDAAIEYIEYMRDAGDLVALAALSRSNGGGAVAMKDYLDRSFVALRGADTALRRMVPLLPST